MFDQITEIMESLSKEKELFDAISKVYGTMRESLLENGFTREEAIELMSRQSPFSAATGGSSTSSSSK